MATILKKSIICDGCKADVPTSAYRVGGQAGTPRALDLCDTCKGRPFTEVLTMGAAPKRRGRPAAMTVEQVEAIAKEQAAATAPRKRAARKVAAAKS
jgi:hypothetical protein